MRLPSRLVWIVLLLASVPAARADEAPAARVRFDEIVNGLDALRTRIDALADAGERAADALFAGHSLAIEGDAAVSLELATRPGGLNAYLAATAREGDAMLLVESQSLTLGDVRIDVSHVPEAAQPVVRLAAAWAWQCEVFAACTRRGRIPVVRLSPEIDTRHRWSRRYGGQTFHHDRWLDPIPRGVLATRYLDAVRAVLRDAGTASWDELAAASQRSADALAADGRVFVHTTGYAARFVPPLFTPLTHDGSDPSLPAPGAADVVIALGISEGAGSLDWADLDLLRNAGGGVVWAVSTYNTHPRDLHRGEVLLDLWTPVGEALVKVEHYDARLGNMSGIVSVAVLHAIAAEAEALAVPRRDGSP